MLQAKVPSPSKILQWKLPPKMLQWKLPPKMLQSPKALPPTQKPRPLPRLLLTPPIPCPWCRKSSPSQGEKSKPAGSSEIAAPPPKPSPPLPRTPPLPPLPPLSEFIGTQHFSPCYFINATAPTLWDGAQQAARLGSEIFKFGLMDKMSIMYPWHNGNMPWPTTFLTMTQIAQHPQVSLLFLNSPVVGARFKIFVLWAYRAGIYGMYWCNRFDLLDQEAEIAQFSELTEHLLTTYAGSGRTFILEHWEGDNALRCGTRDNATGTWMGPLWNPSRGSVDNMTRWLQARQSGVDLGRWNYCKKFAVVNDCSDGAAIMKAAKVKVYHGAVVNMALTSMTDPEHPAMIRSVIPRVALDTLGYSSYESQNEPVLSNVLDFMFLQMNRTRSSPPRPINIAEWGFSLKSFTAAQVAMPAMNLLSIAASKSYVGFTMHWQAINNQAREGQRCPRDGPFFNVSDNAGYCTVWPNATLSYYGQLLSQVIRGSISIARNPVIVSIS